MSQEVRKERFLQAIAVDDDEMLEEIAYQLLPQDEEWLLEMTHADDVNQRWWAARALALCGSIESLSMLTKLLNDTDAGVRAATLLALAHLHDRLPAEALELTLAPMANCLSDDEGYVRQAATDALALCGDDAVDTLANVLAGRHDGARTRATASLRKIATMKAAAILFQHLNDPNYLVHLYAYEALDEMGLLENQLLIL
jgi:HEAT repeat protein